LSTTFILTVIGTISSFEAAFAARLRRALLALHAELVLLVARNFRSAARRIRRSAASAS